MTTEQMKEKLGSMLTEHRYTHSIGVMETAIEMAKRFGVDQEQAMLAGLLHDCAKQIDHDTQIAMCDQLGIVLDQVKRESSALIHADLGARLAETEFGITDESILGAIRYHTLGRANMTQLEKVLYLADIIEPNRKPFEGLAQLRELCQKNLDEAVLYGLELGIANVARKGRTLHTQTAEAEAYYRELLHKEAYPMELLSSLEKAEKAVKVLDAKKAFDITLLKVGELTILADYFIICSANSTTQVRALSDHLEEAFDEIGIPLISREGKQGMNWLLLDYGDCIIHIFSKETREFYGLEKLWDDAEEIDIQGIIND